MHKGVSRLYPAWCKGYEQDFPGTSNHTKAGSGGGGGVKCNGRRGEKLGQGTYIYTRQTKANWVSVSNHGFPLYSDLVSRLYKSVIVKVKEKVFSAICEWERGLLHTPPSYLIFHSGLSLLSRLQAKVGRDYGALLSRRHYPQTYFPSLRFPCNPRS